MSPPAGGSIAAWAIVSRVAIAAANPELARGASMDHTEFDGIARALASATSRRGAVLAALGVLVGAALRPTETAAKRRKRRCTPRCAAGQRCVRGACRCDNGGAVCGAACCLVGQECRDGRCVSEPTPACIPPDQACKNAGRPCCDGRVCASGQGGERDVACYVPKTGRCASTADCVYGTRCENGSCHLLPQPEPTPDGVPTGAPCVDGGEACANPDATCTTYAVGGPVGTFCLLAAGRSCTAPTDCVYEGCVGGICQETCDVCPSCVNDTVQKGIDAAADGGIVRIAAGTYPGTNAVIANKNLTLRNCDGGDAPVLQATSGWILDIRSDDYLGSRTVTLDHLSFGAPAGSPSLTDQTIKANGNSYDPMVFTMKHCAMRFPSTGATTIMQFDQGGYASYIAATIEDSEIQGVMITQFGADLATTLTVKRSTLRGNNAPHVSRAIDVGGITLTVEDTEITEWIQTTSNVNLRGAAIKAGGEASGPYGADVNLKGSTRIWKNESGTSGWGGGLYLYSGTLSIEPTVRITENQAPVDKGAGIWNQGDGLLTITGATSTTVFGNYDTGTTTVAPGNQCRNLAGTSCIA